MPVIGLSSRRAFLALAAFSVDIALCAGEEDAPTLALLTKLAARLSDGNSAGAIDLFAKTMPGYEEAVRNVDALTSQYDIICVIEIRDEQGSESRRQAETEWFLQLRSKQENGPTDRRDTLVRIAAERVGGRWRITSMEPRTLLELPRIP